MDQAHFQSIVATLNPEQVTAVDQITSGWQSANGGVRLTVVDGPPGTGKTHVAAAAAGRWVLDGRGRVVVLTPTHAAAERVQEKLVDVGFSNREILRLSHGSVRYNHEAGLLRFRSIENLPPNVMRALQKAEVLITTWHGSQRAFGAASRFLLLIDEVSQVSFAAFLAILKRAYRNRPSGYALLGDPQQLPVIATQEILATNAALGILRRHPECRPCRLDLQYRMNQPICDVVNEVRRVGFGGRALRVGNEKVAELTLDKLTRRSNWSRSRFAQVLNPRVPVVFVDTSAFASKRQWHERAVGTSWEYAPEAHLACRLAEALRQSFGDSPSIAVSSPYAAQVSLMEQLGERSAITIYRAQGREWDCVILTVARTIGRTILDDVYQNIYVGLSRARCKLIVLLNVELFQQYRLFGAILNLVKGVPGVSLIRADPAWGEP